MDNVELSIFLVISFLGKMSEYGEKRNFVS